MKKRIFHLTLLIFLFILLIPINVYAQDNTKAYIDASLGLKVRKDAGTSYGVVTTLSNKTIVTILDSKKTADSSVGCPTNTWYKISTGSITGYACSQYVIIINESQVTSSEMANMTDKQFDDYLNTQGFPDAYKKSLKELHSKHPNWIFKGIPAKYSWTNALDQEDIKKRSLYQVTSSGVKNGLQGYLDTNSAFYNYETDKFTPLDGSTWFQANRQTVAYFMDPRNFLTDSGIFMFEDLTYHKNFQTDAVVKKILYTDFYKDYIKYYIEAAEKYNVSPVYLAAFSRQEVGLNSGTATSGKAGTYNGVNYDGYYNFFNIGASSGTNPVYNGLAKSKEKGWTTPQKAIVGGAAWIVDGYINQGQYTRYFQKWNVSPTTTTGIWHQYMTDIHALVSPSATTAASYNSMGIANEALVFAIPIYSGMPSSTSLPKTGNPNNWLKDLKVDSKTVANFKGETTSYNLGEVDYTKQTINIATTTVNENASVNISGNVNLSVGTNTIKIIVTSQNGLNRTYTLTIKRKYNPTPPTNNNEGNNNTTETNNDTSNQNTATSTITVSNILNNLSIKNTNSNIYGFLIGTNASNLYQNILKQNKDAKVKITDSSNKEKTTTLFTGDKVTITSNNETKTYNVVIYGDMSGDGKIDAKDLLLLRKHLLNEKKLTNSYLEAAKITKSSTVTAKDLLLLRKYLLGNEKISQV